MREFVFGTGTQYDQLQQTLEDNLCHVFHGCQLPVCCGGHSVRIGFEKEAQTRFYAVLIDKGISCSGIGVPPLFREWLSAGVLRFIDFPDVVEFFRSLRCLY